MKLNQWILISPTAYGFTRPLWFHDDVIKWKHFPRHWPSVRGIHRSTVNSSHKGQWRRAFMFSFICVRINDWVNNREAGGLRRHRVHYDITVMFCKVQVWLDTDQDLLGFSTDPPSAGLGMYPDKNGQSHVYSYICSLRRLTHHQAWLGKFNVVSLLLETCWYVMGLKRHRWAHGTCLFLIRWSVCGGVKTRMPGAIQKVVIAA